VCASESDPDDCKYLLLLLLPLLLPTRRLPDFDLRLLADPSIIGRGGEGGGTSTTKNKRRRRKKKQAGGGPRRHADGSQRRPFYFQLLPNGFSRALNTEKRAP